MQRMTKEQRAVRDADFEQRLQPRMVWASQQAGTFVRKPKEQQGTREPTEAEVNAAGRCQRRHQNKRARGWRPYAKR